jgi:hypothetical protein
MRAMYHNAKLNLALIGASILAGASGERVAA